MKKLLKLMVLLLVCNFGYSQIYYSNYLDATSEWKIINRDTNTGFQNFRYETLFFDGFENIGGYIYYKMYRTYYYIGYEYDYSSVIYPQSSNFTQFVGYFREDNTGKFFMKYDVNSSDIVYFDNQLLLNTQLGDNYFLHYDGLTNQYCSTSTINSMLISGLNSKMIFSGTDILSGGSALEGVGMIFNDCFTPMSIDNNGGMYSRIHCYTKQGQSYAFYNNYHLPNFVLVDCNSFPNANRQGLSTLTYENSNFKVFPNPANTIVNITSNNKNIKEITLSDMQGRLLKTIEVNNINTQLDISNYQTGTYLITIKTDYGTSNSKLIIE